MEGMGTLSMQSFYQGKRVLVTGHTGFKGSWLCQMLLLLGAKVYGYSLSPEQKSLFTSLKLDGKVEGVYKDIRDRESLIGFTVQTKPEIVFHLAAQPIVREAYRKPAETFETNVIGTVNLLEALRICGSVHSFVNITTDKVYDNQEWSWGYREVDSLGGKDPYSCSKSCSELVTQSYRAAFFSDQRIPVSTVRAGNVIGGGDFGTDRILPDCVRGAFQGISIKVRNPNSVRPYQFVLEALYAYLLLAQRQWETPTLEGSYNVGPEQESCVTTGRLVDAFCKCWGNGAHWDYEKPEFAPKESTYLRLDSAKIQWNLGWHPIMNFDETMKWTVAWYCAYGLGKDMAAYSEQEAARYFERREYFDKSRSGSTENFGAGAQLLGAIS